MRADSDGGSTLLFDIWVVANSTRALLDRVLRPSGLTAEEFALYSALRSRDGTTPTQLAALMGLPPTTVSSVVGRLESRGHIQRFPNPPDARSYQIRLTPAGRATHKAATKLFAPVLGEVQDALTVPLDEARTVLVVIAAAVRAATE